MHPLIEYLQIFLLLVCGLRTLCLDIILLELQLIVEFLALLFSPGELSKTLLPIIELLWLVFDHVCDDFITAGLDTLRQIA